MPQSPVRRSARLAQSGSCPRRGSSPCRMTVSMPTPTTTPEMNWVFDEDTGGSIRHVLDQCKACKTWYNHYAQHRDEESDSWQEACQSRLNSHNQTVLPFLEKSDGHKELSALDRQLETYGQELSSLNDKNRFLPSQFQQAVELNHTLEAERDEAGRERTKLLGELFQLRRKIADQEMVNNTLRWRLQHAEQELLQDVSISTTRLSYAHQTPPSANTNATKSRFGTGNMVPWCKAGL